MASEQCFKRLDDPSQVGLILVVVIESLCIKDIMHCDKALIFMLYSGSVSAKLLHLTSNSEEKVQVVFLLKFRPHS